MGQRRLDRRHRPQPRRKNPGARRRPRRPRRISSDSDSDVPVLPFKAGTQSGQLDSAPLAGQSRWSAPNSHTKCPECLQLIPVDTLVSHVSACLHGDSSQGLETNAGVSYRQFSAVQERKETGFATSQPAIQPTSDELPPLGAMVIRGPDYAGSADGWSEDLCTSAPVAQGTSTCLPLGIVIGHTVWTASGKICACR